MLELTVCNCTRVKERRKLNIMIFVNRWDFYFLLFNSCICFGKIQKTVIEGKKVKYEERALKLWLWVKSFWWVKRRCPYNFSNQNMKIFHGFSLDFLFSQKFSSLWLWWCDVLLMQWIQCKENHAQSFTKFNDFSCKWWKIANIFGFYSLKTKVKMKILH